MYLQSTWHICTASPRYLYNYTTLTLTTILSSYHIPLYHYVYNYYFLTTYNYHCTTYPDQSTSWRLHELKNIHTQLFFTSNACMPIAVFLTAKAFSARVAVYFTCIGSHLPPVPSQEFIHGHLVEISFQRPKDGKRPPDNA